MVRKFQIKKINFHRGDQDSPVYIIRGTKVIMKILDLEFPHHFQHKISQNIMSFFWQFSKILEKTHIHLFCPTL